MTPQATDASVRKSVTVDASQERAFTVFTDGMSAWWPLESHHTGAQDATGVVIEPRAGGRWYERGADGGECDWGRVLAWEPPGRVLLAWYLDPDFAFDADSAHATEVEVRFVAEEPGRTRVELEHRGFERHGDRAGETRAAVGGAGGWSSLLEAFAGAAAA